MLKSFQLDEYDAYAYESITVTNTAIGFITSNALNCKVVFMTVEQAQLRFRMDGTDPTSTEGHILDVGDSFTISAINSIRLFKAIRTGSTSAVLKVTYCK